MTRAARVLNKRSLAQASQGSLAKKLHIKTYGCQMNVYDSARMADVMAEGGYVAVDDAADADLIVLNTCHIREKAAEKVYSELGKLRHLKRKIGASGQAGASRGCRMRRASRGRGTAFTRTLCRYRRRPSDVSASLGYRSACRPRGRGLETDFPAAAKFDTLPNRRWRRVPPRRF